MPPLMDWAMGISDTKHKMMAVRDSLKLKLGLVDPVQTVSVGDTTARFYVDNANEYYRASDIAGERNVLSRFLADITSTDVVWDVGAAVGTYSCFAGRIGASVVPFEPHPENAVRLRENLELNDLPFDVREVALSDGNGSVQLSDRGGLGAGKHQVSSIGDIRVSRSTGDQIEPKPDVIKIDVEGHELSVLRGLVRSLPETRVVYVECHPQHGIRQQDVQAELEQAGFRLERIETGRSEPFVRATRPR